MEKQYIWEITRKWHPNFVFIRRYIYISIYEAKKEQFSTNPVFIAAGRTTADVLPHKMER